MSDLQRFDRIMMQAVFGDPKCRAQVEWLSEYGFSAQLEQQWPRHEMEAYVATGEHLNPTRRLSLTLQEPPDFDWWEPRYDQPGRREQTRRREMGVL